MRCVISLLLTSIDFLNRSLHVLLVLGTGREMRARYRGLFKSLHALCCSKNQVLMGSAERAYCEQGPGSDIGGRERESRAQREGQGEGGPGTGGGGRRGGGLGEGGSGGHATYVCAAEVGGVVESRQFVCDQICE